MITGMLIEAFLLGLVGGAVPGPILTGAFTEVLNTNFFRATRIIFYALITETAGALLAIYVIYKIGLSNTAIDAISIGGAIVLFWLAYKIWKIDKINTEAKKILTFYEIVILTALNSGYWIFWIAVGVPKALTLDAVILGGKFIFLTIFEIGWLVATAFLVFVFFKFRPLLLRKNLVKATFKVLACVLVILGIKTLLQVNF